MSEEQVEAICDAVRVQVQQVTQTVAFGEFERKERLRAGNLILFNNSFLFREGVKTHKSEKQLCLTVSEEGLSPSPQVIRMAGFHLRFKRYQIPDGGSPKPWELPDAVRGELTALGLIVRALIGEIGADEPAEVLLDKVDGFRALRYEPAQPEIVVLVGDSIRVKRLDDVDALWSAVQRAVDAAKGKEVGKLAADFETKIAELRELAHRPVHIDRSSGDNSIIGELIGHIDAQTEVYAQALRGHRASPANPERLNDLLRISYNFADGVQELMKLVIGLSDMKPLVFWLSMAAQLELEITLLRCRSPSWVRLSRPWIATVR